jgi:hypothetical protein
MANVTKTETAAMTPVQVAEMSLGALAGNLQLARVADRNWEAKFASQGESVDVPVRAAVTANDKAAGADVTLQAPSATKVTITLSAHKEVSIVFEDVARAFANQDVLLGYAEDSALALAEAIEVAGFVEAYTAFTTNADIGAAGTPVDHALVLSGRKRMKDAKVPKNGAIYLFLGTGAMMDLLGLPEYRDADKIGTAEVVDNAPMEFRRYGVNFVESQYAQTVAGTVHNLMLCPKQGLALACRPLDLPPGGVISAEVVGGTEETPDTAGLGIRQVVTYEGKAKGVLLSTDVLFGWKVIRGAFGQDVLS